MKKFLHFSIIALALLGLSVSCELITDLVDIRFETKFSNIDFTIKPSAAGEHTFKDTVLQSDIKAEIEEHGGDIDQLDEIKIYEAILSIETEGIKFDTFDWVEVYVSTAEIEEIMVGSIKVSDGDLSSATLVLSDKDLKDIISAEEYYVRVVGFLNKDLAIPVEMLLKLKYQVVV